MSTSTQTFRGKVTVENSGIRWFKSAQTVTTPGIEQTLLSEVVSAGTEVSLLKINLSCFQPGRLRVLVDADEIASVRTESGMPNIEFSWLPFHSAIAAQTIDVKFIPIASKPVSDIEVQIQGREISV